uniref:Uncharacterized protein n=1 Tax=Tanacetum cinerariifolium TaxID=118510 RepID=A0A6L2JJE4_TANCI|nr:hypothetical protein [Tanacetum cinerariifolium]
MAKNPAPLTHAKQVGFNLEDVIMNTNNEVALLYPEHSNKEGYLSEFCYSANTLDNSKVSFSNPTRGIYGVLRVNTFGKAIGTHYLSHSSDYMDPPSIDIVRPWFLTIGYGEEVSAKSTLKKSLLPPSQTSASTPVVAEMHKEDLQATGGPTSLGVTGEARANPQLSSGMSAFNLNEPIYSTSFIIHSESASGNDASAISTAEADLRIFAPSGFIPQQQDMNEETKNNSYDHLFAGTDPHVLIDETKYVSDGWKTVLTTPETGTSNATKTSEEIKFGVIKLEDLAKLVANVKVDFKDIDSPEDDHIIMVDDNEEDEEDKNEEIHLWSLLNSLDRL